MRRPFWNLYKKELKENLPLAVVMGILALAWFIFLGIQKKRLGFGLGVNDVEEVIFGLSWIPLTLLPLFAVVQGFLSYRNEWKDDTIFTVLSLPVPGWYFSATKFLATMTYFTGMSFLMLAAIGLLSQDLIREGFEMLPTGVGLSWFYKGAIGIYLAGWLFSGLNYLICQFSYLVSRLFNRFIAVITGVTFMLSYWFLFRVGAWVTWFFRWVPDYPLEAWHQSNGFTFKEILHLETAPWIALLALGVGLAWFGSWLLENVLEV